MAKKGQLLSNIIFLGLASVVSKLTVFFMLPVYTSHLSPAAFGTVDVLVNTAVLLLPLVSFGAPEAVFRFAAGGEAEGDVLAVGRKMLRFGFLLLLPVLPVLFLFDVLRSHLLHLTLYVCFSVLHSYFSHLLRARGQYGLYAAQQVFCTAVTVTLAYLFLAVLKLGVGGYLCAVFVGDGITALILAGYLRPHRQKTTKKPSDLFRRMLRYAIPLIPTAALWWILAVSDRYILLYTHGQAVTGIYAAAGKLPALLTFATGLFLEAWHFAVIHESETGRQHLFERIYGALLPALVVFVGALILLSDLLVRYLFAADFREAARFVPFLAIAAMFSALSSFLGSVYVVRLRSGASLLTAAVGAGVNLALDAWWIPFAGAWGAMGATLVSYLLVFVWRAMHCKRVLPFVRHGRKLALSTALLLLTAFLTVQGARLGAYICGALSVFPFWRQIGDSVRTLWRYGQKILRISTKKRNLY